MRISRSTQAPVGSDIRVTALVDGQPLWFKFPADCAPLISGESDPFVVAMLLLAMQKGETLHVEGTVSRKLHEGLVEYQRVIHSWYPERFQVIEVLPEGLREETRPDSFFEVVGHRREAVAFSGGVDSFYSYLALKPRLTHGLFMAGFDMPLNLVDSIGELTRSYTEMFEQAGKRLIVGSTNVRQFVNAVDWTNAHGTALAASALFFEGLWSRFFIPSSYTGASYPKWGTHPELDPHLSTERLTFVHEGATLNRVGKLARIIQAPESYARLRVCWIQDIGLRNCGECEKCVRTQIALELLGARSCYATFDAAKFTRARVRKLFLRTHQSRVFARELVRESAARGRATVMLDVGWALLKRRARHLLRSGFGSGRRVPPSKPARPGPAPRA